MNPSSARPQGTLLEQVVHFGRALHDADLPVSPADLLSLCQCFSYIDIGQRDDFYAAARATLVSRREDIPRFDAVFARFWESPDRLLIKKRRKGKDEDKDKDDKSAGTKILLEDPEEEGEDPNEKKDLHLSYSPDEVLATRDLGTLTDADVERAHRLIRELVAAMANKKSRRYSARQQGRVLDFRKLLRSRAHFADDGICRLPFKARRIKKTKLVLLCDVSGSMQRYSSFLIQFMFALRRELSDLEVAVFSTHLTVITDLLKAKGVEASLKQVAHKVHDWAGGTNIGASLQEFNEKYAPSMLRSRTVVIFLSDGWDRGDPQVMRAQMDHLHRRAHRLLWLNPLLGTPGYQPLTLGMQTALPYLDHFLPAHNLQSLSQLARTLRTLGT